VQKTNPPEMVSQEAARGREERSIKRGPRRPRDGEQPSKNDSQRVNQRAPAGEIINRYREPSSKNRIAMLIAAELLEQRAGQRSPCRDCSSRAAERFFPFGVNLKSSMLLISSIIGSFRLVEKGKTSCIASIEPLIIYSLVT